MASLFAWENGIDDAVLSAGDQVSTLPVANIADRRVQKCWRSGTSTSTYFTVDFGSSISVGIIGLFGLTLADTDTIRIRLSNISVAGSELLDTGALASGVVDGYGQYVYLPNAAITARYMRVDIDAASRSSAGYFDVGRVWAGPTWQPTINYSPGWGEKWNDNSQVVTNWRSGAAFVDAGAVFRSMNVTFRHLLAADKAQAMELDRQAGLRMQVLFVNDTTGDLARVPLLGRMTEIALIEQALNSSPARFSKTYRMDQDL